MRLLRSTKSNSKNLVVLGAQAFLTGSICRYLNTAAGFSSVSIGSATAHSNHLSSPIDCGCMVHSFAGVRPNVSGSSSRLFASNDGPTLTNIEKEQMQEIVEDYEQGGREDSGYVVMDVREESEVAMTGKVSPNTHTLPLSIVGSQLVFEMDEDEFEIVCGFPKPTPDETLVFTCAAGIRSQNAAAYAAQAGYMQLVNYKGGAYDWFTGN